MKRRTFIQSTAVVATMAIARKNPLLAAIDADSTYRKNIGIQLYTLRNELAKDTTATILQVAADGYKQVEPFGFPNADPMIEAAKKAGLAVNSSHFVWASVVNPKDDSMSDFATILEKAEKVGLKHLVIPYLQDNERASLDHYKKIAANANKAAAMAKKAGIQLAYHNHNFEFQPMEGDPKKSKQCGYDVFVEEFSPDMKFEVDVFWVRAAGVDPVALINKLRGRVTQLHLKDLKAGLEMPTYSTGVPKDAFQELGDGIIPMEPILVAAKTAGVEHCHVEQDQSPDPLASIKQSIDYLNKL